MPCSLEVVFSSFPTEAIKTNWHFQKGQGLLPTSMVTSHHILRKGNDSFLGFVCLYVLVWFWFWMLVFSFFFFLDLNSGSLWMSVAVGGLQHPAIQAWGRIVEKWRPLTLVLMSSGIMMSLNRRPCREIARTRALKSRVLRRQAEF